MPEPADQKEVVFKPNVPMRTIRSFVRRGGRLRGLQREALAALRSASHALFPWANPDRPVMLEIGFGKGEALLDFAARHQDWYCMGIEVHTPGLAAVWHAIQHAGWEHVHVREGDATQMLQEPFPEAVFQEVRIFFPDPWHKKKHRKRRLIQPAFLDVLCRVVREGGRVHVATDWADYAEAIQQIWAADPRWIPDPQPETELRTARIGTRFEQRGVRLGHAIVDLAYIKRKEC